MNRQQESENFKKLQFSADLAKLVKHTRQVGFFNMGEDASFPHIEFAIPDTQIKDRYWCKDDSNCGENLYEYTLRNTRTTKIIYDYDATYFKDIYNLLSAKYKLGRMRLLGLQPNRSLSWHREPDERIVIPVITNPGAHMVIGGENKHLPADGSAWYLDTTKFHTAFNGGFDLRVHLLITYNGELG